MLFVQRTASFQQSTVKMHAFSSSECSLSTQLPVVRSTTLQPADRSITAQTQDEQQRGVASGSAAGD